MNPPSEEELDNISDIISKGIIEDNPSSDMLDICKTGYLYGFADGYTKGVDMAYNEMKKYIDRKNNMIKIYERRLKELLEIIN